VRFSSAVNTLKGLPMTDGERRLTDESAQKVLARALELQAQAAGALTVVQIREIASELSIPESAVDQALSEYRVSDAAALSARTDAAVAPASLRRHQLARSVVVALALVGGGVVLLTIFFVVVRSFPSS
jgi:hypothetical protein